MTGTQSVAPSDSVGFSFCGRISHLGKSRRARRTGRLGWFSVFL